jgi:hypothetical protein
MFFYFQYVIHEPTRINQNTGNGTLLDPVWISADCNVTFSEVIDVCRLEKKVTTVQRKFLFKFQITYKKRTSEQYGCIRMQTLKDSIK